jgi:hypothetical protein
MRSLLIAAALFIAPASALAADMPKDLRSGWCLDQDRSKIVGDWTLTSYTMCEEGELTITSKDFGWEDYDCTLRSMKLVEQTELVKSWYITARCKDYYDTKQLRVRKSKPKIEVEQFHFYLYKSGYLTVGAKK